MPKDHQLLIQIEQPDRREFKSLTARLGVSMAKAVRAFIKALIKGDPQAKAIVEKYSKD